MRGMLDSLRQMHMTLTALQPGEAFDAARSLTRGDVRFGRDARGQEYVALRIRVAKRSPGREKETTLLLGGGGSLLDPVKALKRLCALPTDALEATLRAAGEK